MFFHGLGGCISKVQIAPILFTKSAIIVNFQPHYLCNVLRYVSALEIKFLVLKEMFFHGLGGCISEVQIAYLH
jgi:hypothetical protein